MRPGLLFLANAVGSLSVVSLCVASSSLPSSVVRARLICPTVLNTPSLAWKDPKVRELRLEAVIAHQNRIREGKSLPKLSSVPSSSDNGREVLEFQFETIEA